MSVLILFTDMINDGDWGNVTLLYYYTNEQYLRYEQFAEKPEGLMHNQ